MVLCLSFCIRTSAIHEHVIAHGGNSSTGIGRLVAASTCFTPTDKRVPDHDEIS
jgi:hypothetical protein